MRKRSGPWTCARAAARPPNDSLLICARADVAADPPARRCAPVSPSAQFQQSGGSEVKAGVVVDATEEMEIDGSKGSANAILKCATAPVHPPPAASCAKTQETQQPVVRLPAGGAARRTARSACSRSRGRPEATPRPTATSRPWCRSLALNAVAASQYRGRLKRCPASQRFHQAVRSSTRST